MLHKSVFIAILVLALATLACGININLPVTEIKTGPTVTDDLNVPLLSDPKAVADIKLSFGAGNLTVKPGAEEALVSGTATYNVPDFKPVITVDANTVSIEQGSLNLHGIPSFKGNLTNEWKLELGQIPMMLHITAGAYKGVYDLGGLSLTGLSITDGAADTEVSFSEPNKAEMDLFEYTTGASNVTLTGLGNANVANILFRSGAGSYTLDFSGELKRDIQVTVESGISNVVIKVPDGVSAQLTLEGGLSNVVISSSWEKSGGIYVHSGEGHQITIMVKMGAGNLDLH